MIQVTRIESHGAFIARITFDRPAKKNALTPDMLEHLRLMLGELSEPRSPSAGAVLLDGNGAAFCSGFDLTLCKENSDALRILLTSLSAAISAMRSCPLPVVVAAHGAALAGGCALLGGADLVVSHTDARIGYPVVRLGISPAVSAPFLAQSVGFGPARERLLDSSLISGWQALQLGLVHECIEDAGKVRERALQLAELLALKPAGGMRATKALLNELDESLDDPRIRRALETSLSLVGCPEERARVAQLWRT